MHFNSIKCICIVICIEVQESLLVHGILIVSNGSIFQMYARTAL